MRYEPYEYILNTICYLSPFSSVLFKSTKMSFGVVVNVLSLLFDDWMASVCSPVEFEHNQEPGPMVEL